MARTLSLLPTKSVPSQTCKNLHKREEEGNNKASEDISDMHRRENKKRNSTMHENETLQTLQEPTKIKNCEIVRGKGLRG